MRLKRKGLIYVLLAAGFEEYDVVTVTRTLRQRGLAVALVGLASGPIRGCYGISMAPDKTLSQIEAEEPLAVVLPGGSQGIRQLNGDPRVHSLLRSAAEQSRYLVSLDPGNTVLWTAGILTDVENAWAEKVSSLQRGRLDDRVAVAGRLILGLDEQAAQESADILASLLENGPKIV